MHSLKTALLRNNSSVISSCRFFKTITFRIPEADRKKETKTIKVDPNLTWPIMESIIQRSQGNDASVSSVEEQKVLRAFGMPSSGKLPLPKPTIRPSPYEYFCSVNEDASHISQPRLSVTKLLTSGWCELRSFYEIYAGLKATKNRRLSSGIAYHEKLEKAAHPALDEDVVQEQLEKVSTSLTKEEKQRLFKTKMAHKLASQWSERIVTRLIGMAKTKILREIQVHGFLNIENNKLATSKKEIERSILVNGVVDIIHIDKHNHTAKEAEYDRNVEEHLEVATKSMPQEIIDLSIEIPRAKKSLTALAKDHYLHVCDVKTRAYDSIPAQESVLLSARDQCMIYSEFIHNLSRNSEFGYECSLENARRRNVDPDAPISVGFATELLVNQFSTLALDFRRIANGSPIGFEDYDKQASSSSYEYSLSEFVKEEEFKQMLVDLYGENSPFLELDLSSLFRPWKSPLTLRYFAARAGEAYNTLSAFLQGSVSVEYHRLRTKKVLARIHYSFDDHLLSLTVQRSSSFWSGQRQPQATLNLSRCSKCCFANRCPVKNSSHENNFGKQIYELYD